MANRHLARSVVLQTLFEWDFSKEKNRDTEEIFKRNAAEFAPGISDVSFMEKLLNGCISKINELDKVITSAAPDWPIEKTSTIDRNVLRIGLYELLFADRKEVPPKVAINEAIELAKTFGGETSGRFVNGVLGAVYKEIGEPGKNEESPNKKKGKDGEEKITLEELGGAVVYSIEKGRIYLGLVHDVFGHWTLSKGKLEAGEDVKTGTIREIKEEIGVDITLEEDLGKNEYIAFHPEKGKLKKRVNYFLGKSDYTPLKLESSGGLDDARWFPIEEVADLNFYDDVFPIVTKAIQSLVKKTGK